MTACTRRGSLRAGVAGCLDYPDEQWRQRLPLLHAAADARWPARRRRTLRRFLAAVADAPALAQLAAGLRRDLRHPPPLQPVPDLLPTATPASAGWPCCGSSRPTAAAGFELDDAELPDHLAVC